MDPVGDGLHPAPAGLDGRRTARRRTCTARRTGSTARAAGTAARRRAGRPGRARGVLVDDVDTAVILDGGGEPEVDLAGGERHPSAAVLEAVEVAPERDGRARPRSGGRRRARSSSTCGSTRTTAWVAVGTSNTKWQPIEMSTQSPPWHGEIRVVCRLCELSSIRRTDHPIEVTGCAASALRVAQAGNGNSSTSGTGSSGWDTNIVPGLRIVARWRCTAGRKPYSLAAGLGGVEAADDPDGASWRRCGARPRSPSAARR